MCHVDLHVHSCYSDGSQSPAELVALAESLGLAALALTDHDTTAGLKAFLAAGTGSPVETICGVEFSTHYLGQEVHVLGLFVAERYFKDVDDYARPMISRKRKRGEDISKLLVQAGYDVPFEEVAAAKPASAVISSVDIAALLASKYRYTFDSAFSIVKSFKAQVDYTPHQLESMQTIDFIRSIGAVPVLAHPYISMQSADVDAFIRDGLVHGLGGMEVYYSAYDDAVTERAKSAARHFDLAESGGSDFHGTRKVGVQLGTGKGNLRVPAEVLPALRNA